MSSFLLISVSFSKALPNGEYSNLFSAVAFSSNSVFGKTSLSVQNSYLLIFPDDEAALLAVYLSELY